MTNTTQSVPTDPALVHAYIDSELDPADALAMARQIDSDPMLAAEVARDGAIGLTRARHQPTWRALAASVVFGAALASGSTWLAVYPRLDNRMADAVVDSHIRALMAPQPADVISSERHTVKPWFNGRLPVSPRVVDLATEGFPLIGGRVDVIGAMPTPTLVYGRRKHVISLSAISDASATEAVPTSRSINGYNVAVWRQNQTMYWAISDLNAAELQTFAQKFQAAP
jgi:anti-sigma factor RsiW